MLLLTGCCITFKLKFCSLGFMILVKLFLSEQQNNYKFVFHLFFCRSITDNDKMKVDKQFSCVSKSFLPNSIKSARIWGWLTALGPASWRWLVVFDISSDGNSNSGRRLIFSQIYVSYYIHNMETVLTTVKKSFYKSYKLQLLSLAFYSQISIRGKMGRSVVRKARIKLNVML